MLEVLATGDVHMSNRLPYARPSERYRTDRLDQQLAMWGRLGEYAAEHGLKHLLLLGDVFDKALLDPVTLTETCAALTSLARIVRIKIIPGNHDALTIRGGRYNVEALKELPNVDVLMPGEHFGLDGVTFWAMPYASLEENRATLADIRARAIGEGPQVLLMHNSVLGCSHGGWKCDVGLDPSELDGFTHVISGHFHTHQKFGSTGMYLGAPMQHHFGDVGDRRGAWHLKFKGGSLKRKFIDTKMPRFHSLDEVGIPPDAVPGDYVQWTIEATRPDWVKLRPDVEAAKQMAVDGGYHVHVNYKPIYQHTERITTADGEIAKITTEKMIGRYVNNANVNTGELDIGELRKLGVELLDEARARRR